MSVFTEAISEGLKAISCIAGDEITYHRDPNFVVVIAVEGRSDFSSIDHSGSNVEFSTFDFIISTDDLIINGVNAVPQAGDYVTRTIGNKLFTYRVRRPDSGQLYSFSDAKQERMRIHTLFVGETPL